MRFSSRPFANAARAVGSLLTATPVMPVMPVFMVTVPNPSGRDGWRIDCDRGINYVWPLNFGAWLAVVMAYAIVPHLPRKKRNRRNSSSKLSLTNSRNSPPEFCAFGERPNKIFNFSLTIPSNLISSCEQMLAVAQNLVLYTGEFGGPFYATRRAQNDCFSS